MSQTVIKIENLSKLYRLGQIGTGTLSHDLNRWWRMNILRQPDPYTKVGQVNNLAPLNPPKGGKANSPSFGGGRGEADLVWALKDINFEVKQGEVLGIIGKNGAGKSTLLKILSKVTSPTTGSIKVKGRIASLLEVGTGFNPELTGRENIYMNGTIMGMRKWEIDKKFDEIIDFAGVAKYIDTPVKRYSSGMTVRLGFAVAAHLEPEILVVDEVLAVGDAEFQKKAIGKMQEVSQGQGRTVLFVSHNMAAVKSLCKSGIVLANGSVNYSGNSAEAITNYLTQNNYNELQAEIFREVIPNKDFQLIYAKVCNQALIKQSNFECDEDVYLFFMLRIIRKIPGLYGYLSIIKKDDGTTVLVSDSNDLILNFFDFSPIGNVEINVKIPKRTLGAGNYIIYLNFTSSFNIATFNVDSPCIFYLIHLLIIRHKEVITGAGI